MPPADLSWCRGDLARFALPRRFALLVPGSSPHRPVKRWPVANYRVLAEWLIGQGLAPVVLGGAGETMLGRAICSSASPSRADAAGDGMAGGKLMAPALARTRAGATRDIGRHTHRRCPRPDRTDQLRRAGRTPGAPAAVGGRQRHPDRMHLLAAAGCPSLILFSRELRPRPLHAMRAPRRPAGPRAAARRPGNAGPAGGDGSRCTTSSRSRRRHPPDGRPAGATRAGTAHAGGRWGAAAAALLGDPDHRARPDAAGIRTGPWTGPSRGAADHRTRRARLAVGVDLGGECLPARGDDFPVAARLAGGDLRLPAHLPGWSGGVHHRLPVLRPVRHADHADHRPRAAGVRRRRHHECERRPGPLHLPAPLDRPRSRAERDDRLDRLGAWPDRRRPASCPVGNWPWLFCGEHPARHDRCPDRHGPPAGHAHLRRQVRHRQRGAERVHLRPADHRYRRPGPRREGLGDVGARVVHRRRPGVSCWWRGKMARRAPLLPIDLLRIPLFALSVATSVCAFVAQSMALVCCRSCSRTRWASTPP